MQIALKASTAGAMRDEAVRYLNFVSERFTNGAYYKNKTQKLQNDAIAAAIQACADDLKAALIIPDDTMHTGSIADLKAALTEQAFRK